MCETGTGHRPRGGTTECWLDDDDDDDDELYLNLHCLELE